MNEGRKRGSETTKQANMSVLVWIFVWSGGQERLYCQGWLSVESSQFVFAQLFQSICVCKAQNQKFPHRFYRFYTN